ncbi:MAG: glycosyltransferase [Oceanococcus sp.]
MAKKHNNFVQAIKWWWMTRVVGFWRIKLAGGLQRAVQTDGTAFEFKRKAEAMAEPSEEGITVILTGYRRTEYLAQQIKALREQTRPPQEIWVWTNQSEDDLRDVSDLADRVVVSNSNYLFWGRFALANLVRTGYVAFFDDDILPPARWFENCLDTIQSGYDGILGGSGVILPEAGGYSSKNKAGWNGLHSTSPVEVDLVGHAWFMRKKYVKYMWMEEPHSWDNGEDIHLSYMALKHAGVKTWVPPHPDSDPSLWSCRPDFGKVVGRLKVATYKTSNHRDTRSLIVDANRADGWQIVECRNPQGSVDAQKDFTQELQLFNRKLREQDNFALVRFGDGEMLVINGESIDLSEKCNGEHKYSPGDDNDERHRAVLAESLVHQQDNYFVGLPCRCCVGDALCERLRVQSRQPEERLTWANIFVNSNYPKFLQDTVAALKQRPVVVVCHEKADLSGLPFEVVADFRVGANAWVQDYDGMLEKMLAYLQSQPQNQVFLFSAGVLSNMLIYQLAKAFPENTYLDVGSVFDDLMGLGKTRKYLKGSRKRLNQVCVW